MRALALLPTDLKPLRAVLPHEAGRTPGSPSSLRTQPPILRPHTENISLKSLEKYFRSDRPGGGEAGAGAQLVVLDPPRAQAKRRLTCREP